MAFHERIWEVRWNENAKKLVICQISSDSYGNSTLNKKIKMLTPEHPDYPEITDGKSLLEAAVSLVERYSSKTSEPDTFIGTR